MTLPLLLNYIGENSPIILFFLTAYFLRNLNNFLYFFFQGFIFNNILNILLKLFFKEPRPSNKTQIQKLAIANEFPLNFNIYGMPSAHAENCGFFLSYIALVLQNYYINILYLVIIIITILQRFINKNHTILQLFVGFFIGVFIGYITYFLANKSILGDVKMKTEENAPI